MKETELFIPVKKLLIDQGYDVKAEVKDIDIIGEKQSSYIAVELKTSFSMKLIYQAIDRQKTMDIVYIAIPKEALPKTRSQFRHMTTLLKRLELGLIVVDNHRAEVMIEVKAFDMTMSRSRYKKRKKTIINEFKLRKNHHNIAGTNGKKLTSYKEMVYQIGTYLMTHGDSQVKDIKAYTKIEKTASILQKNYHQYFQRVRRGIYQLTDKGIQGMIELNDLLKGYDNGTN